MKSIALNLNDHHQRDHGFPPITHYAAVLGSDLECTVVSVAGTVVSAGASVASNAPKPGSRVAALKPCLFVQGAPDYRALQTRVFVPAANVTPLPQGMSFDEANLLPMPVLTAWSEWYSIVAPRDSVQGYGQEGDASLGRGEQRR